jgi:hypothetical protein
LAVGSGSWQRQLAVDNGSLAVGSWQLAVGSWQLAVGSGQWGVGQRRQVGAAVVAAAAAAAAQVDRGRWQVGRHMSQQYKRASGKRWPVQSQPLQHTIIFFAGFVFCQLWIILGALEVMAKEHRGGGSQHKRTRKLGQIAGELARKLAERVATFFPTNTCNHIQPAEKKNGTPNIGITLSSRRVLKIKISIVVDL